MNVNVHYANFPLLATAAMTHTVLSSLNCQKSSEAELIFECSFTLVGWLLLVSLWAGKMAQQLKLLLAALDPHDSMVKGEKDPTVFHGPSWKVAPRTSVI